MTRSEHGSAYIDVIVWMVAWALLGQVVLAIVRSPVPGVRLGYAVDTAADAGARQRDPASAEAAVTRELERNLLGPGNPTVCASSRPEVDDSHLAPVVRDGEPPVPGYVEVVVSCTVTGRTLSGTPIDASTTVEARGRHVADVYRRAG